MTCSFGNDRWNFKPQLHLLLLQMIGLLSCV